MAELDYYDVQRIAEDAARTAKYDAVREARELVDVETTNRRDSESDIREGLAELAGRVADLETRARSAEVRADLLAVARVETILRGRGNDFADEIYALGCELGSRADTRLTSSQIDADLERYDHVAAWREEA